MTPLPPSESATPVEAVQPEPAKTIRTVISELRWYNPAADRYEGKYIHKGWADRLESALATPPAAQGAEPAKFWLWKNFVDGKPEFWAFDNPFPVHMDGGDPQTLGEPCGYAIFKPSRIGRTDVSEEQVLRRIAAIKPAQGADERAALILAARLNAWTNFGECRAFGDGPIATPAEVDAAARAALSQPVNAGSGQAVQARLREALIEAEAALSDIGDGEGPVSDIVSGTYRSWTLKEAEKRAAMALPKVRAALSIPEAPEGDARGVLVDQASALRQEPDAVDGGQT